MLDLKCQLNGVLEVEVLQIRAATSDNQDIYYCLPIPQRFIRGTCSLNKNTGSFSVKNMALPSNGKFYEADVNFDIQEATYKIVETDLISGHPLKRVGYSNGHRWESRSLPSCQ